MNILWILTLLTVLGVTIFTARVAIFLRRCPVLPTADAVPNAAPLISIVVPARNEAANVERCVRSLLAQDYPNLEVIAIDDGSTDATPAILAQLAATDSRLRVVRGGQLPPGWTGKSHAVHVGVQSARGDWLLFVDADVILAPSAVSAAYLAARRHRVALLSLWAGQELVSFWECVLQPVIVGMNQATDPFQRGNSARHPETAFANGQFILVERGAYERIGGHTAVRDEVVEDQMLARHFKRAGYPIMMLDGTRVLKTRMYSSLAGIWEGWSKNNFLMLGRNLLVTLAAVLSVYFVAVSPFALVVAIPLAGFKFNYQVLDPLLLNLLAVTVVLALRWRASGYFPTPLRYYIWHPLGGLLFIAIMINSAYRHLWGRGVKWKGRKYRDVDPIG
jgi:chlorobactene glucosyltransferase